MYTSKTRGLDAAEAHQRRLAKSRPVSVAVTCTAAGGRTAGENVVILRTQATKGRNVIFFDRKEQAAGEKQWQAAVAQVTAGRARPLIRGGKKVGAVMVDAIRAHVQEGRRERGRVKPLAESTIKRKERETGKKNQPALVRTGALMDSLIPDVREM